MKRRFVATLLVMTCLSLVLSGVVVAQTGGTAKPGAKSAGVVDVKKARTIGFPMPVPGGPVGRIDVSMKKGLGVPVPKPAPLPGGPVVDVGHTPTDKTPGITPPHSNGSDIILETVRKQIILSPNDPIWPPTPPTTPPNVFGVGATRTFGIHQDDDPAPPAPDNGVWVSYLKYDSATNEEVELVVNLDGELSYRHDFGPFGIGPDIPWSVELNRKVDTTTTALVFGVMSAAGFMDFPNDFPPGGSHKHGFDTWITWHDQGAEKTVFAPGGAMVPKGFDTLQAIFDTVTFTLENSTVFALDVWDESTGSYAGGITVQADGDAQVRLPATIGGFDLTVRERTLSPSRMASLHSCLDSADFFTLPACGDFTGGTGFDRPFVFKVTYNANGNEKTIHFGSESEAAEALTTVVDWILTVVM